MQVALKIFSENFCVKSETIKNFVLIGKIFTLRDHCERKFIIRFDEFPFLFFLDLSYQNIFTRLSRLFDKWQNGKWTALMRCPEEHAKTTNHASSRDLKSFREYLAVNHRGEWSWMTSENFVHVHNSVFKWWVKANGNYREPTKRVALIVVHWTLPIERIKLGLVKA